MATPQEDQAVDGPSPGRGSENFDNFVNWSATNEDDGRTYQQGQEAAQTAGQDAVPQVPQQLPVTAHADNAINGAPAVSLSSPMIETRGRKRVRTTSTRQACPSKVQKLSPSDGEASGTDQASLRPSQFPENDIARRITQTHPGIWLQQHVRNTPSGSIYRHFPEQQFPPQLIEYTSFPRKEGQYMYITDVYTLGGAILCIFVDLLAHHKVSGMWDPQIFDSRGRGDLLRFRAQCSVRRLCFVHPADVDSKGGSTSIEQFLGLKLGNRKVVPNSVAKQRQDSMTPQENGAFQTAQPANATMNNAGAQEIMNNHPFPGLVAGMGEGQQNGPAAATMNDTRAQGVISSHPFPGLLAGMGEGGHNGPAAATMNDTRAQAVMFNHAYHAPTADMGGGQQIGAPVGQYPFYEQSTGLPQDLPPQAYGQIAPTAQPQQQFPVGQYGMPAPEANITVPQTSGHDDNMAFLSEEPFNFGEQNFDPNMMPMFEGTMFGDDGTSAANGVETSTDAGSPGAAEDYGSEGESHAQGDENDTGEPWEPIQHMFDFDGPES